MTKTELVGDIPCAITTQAKRSLEKIHAEIIAPVNNAVLLKAIQRRHQDKNLSSQNQDKIVVDVYPSTNRF